MQPVQPIVAPVAKPSNKPLFLLVLAVLLLLGVSIFLTFRFKSPASIFQTQNLGFSNPYEKARFDELLQTKKAGDLITAFLTLYYDYNREPSAQKRDVLVQMKTYIDKNYPEEAKKANLSIPCRETSCGAVFGYSDKLSNIKNQVSENSLLDSMVKQAILHNLDNVALAAGNNNMTLQFNSLSSVFSNLKSSWQKTNDENTKKLAEDVLSLMQETSPDLFKRGQQDGLWTL